MAPPFPSTAAVSESPRPESRASLASSLSSALPSSSSASSSANRNSLPEANTNRKHITKNPFPAAFIPSYRRIISATSWRAGLDSITLDAVLHGETRSPIALPDLYHFLRYSDFSVENLLFVWWFEGYRARWESAFGSADPTAGRNVPRTSIPHITKPEPAKARTAHVASLSTSSSPYSSESSTPSGSGSGSESLSMSHELDINSFYQYASDLHSEMCDAPPNTGFPIPQSIGSEKAHPVDRQESDTPIDEEAFRSEISRVLDTFVLTSARHELLLEAGEREKCIKEANLSTHWQAFTPLYETALTHLRLVSLPRFLLANSQNITMRTRRFWGIFGSILISLGIAMAIMLIRGASGMPGYSHKEEGESTASSDNNFVDLQTLPDDSAYQSSPRRYRLLALIPFWFGVGTLFPAYRGFCGITYVFFSRVQRRGWDDECSTRTTEEEEWDAEWINSPSTNDEKKTVERVYIKESEPETAKHGYTLGLGRIAPFVAQTEPPTDLEANGSIAPWDTSPPSKHSRTGFSTGSSSSSLPAEPNQDTKTRRSLGSSLKKFLLAVRPAPFGPGRYLPGSRMDRTMRKVYMRQWKELWAVPTIATIVFAAIILPIPSPAHYG